jgi:prepilin-type N-terminal cleavage/methylation domain-containing protein
LVIAGSVILGALFLVAAAGKLVHIHQFAEVIDILLIKTLEHSGLPLPHFRIVLTIGIVAIETVLGASLLAFASRPRVPAVAAFMVLVAFSCALVYMTRMQSPPDCGCLGGWDLVKRDAKAGAYLGLVRNVGLLLLAGWLALPTRIAPQRRVARAAPNVRPGFTLIEIVVAIFVIAILIAILLPALAGARKQARETERLSAMRQCFAAIALYTADEAGHLPYLAEPHKPELGALPEVPWDDLPPPYFLGQAFLWPTALLRQGSDLSGLPGMTVKGGQQRPRIHTFIWMTHAAHARPEYWVGEDVPDPDDTMYAGVRLDEAVFPSSKGLLLDVGWGTRITSWKVAFVDGSASFKSTTDPPGDVEYLNRPYGAVPWRVMSTPQGIRGRDY